MMKLSRATMLLLVATLLLPVLSGLASAMDSDCPDQYVYTKQPPTNLFVCNPYITHQLSLSCSVIGQNVTDIQWWYDPGFGEGGTTQLRNGSKYALQRVLVGGVLEMQLTVNNLNDDDAGNYWCQASIVDAHRVQLLSKSEILYLGDEDSFDGITNSCSFILKNADTRCATVLMTESASIVPTTFPEPTTSSLSTLPATSHPSPTTLPSSLSTTGSNPVTVPAVPQPPPSLFESSSGILYAVLGLVGFLAVVCVLLVVIVIVLCRRRCGKADIKGDLEEKELSFEHFSHESDMPLMYKHAVPSRIIHSDTHSRNLSGEYAEIGPALSGSLERGYSLIGVSRTSLPPLPTELDPDVDQLPTPGYENPYDLPVFPLGQARQQRQMDDGSGSKSPEVHTEGTDSQSLESHEYHMLEQIAPLSPMATTSASPISPQHTYHILENPNSHLTSSSVSCDSGSAPIVAGDSPYDDVIHHEPSPRLSCSSATTESGRLPTIPENELEDQQSMEHSDVVNPAHPKDTVSPDIALADPEDCTGFSECSKDDGEYDRLVDPPHLYHILEHSPQTGCPRIHNIDPSMYSSLETGYAAKRKATHLQMHVHLLTPQSGVTNLTYSSGSSLDASETTVFDDPQYLVSTPRRMRLAKSTCGTERRELRRSHSYSHEHPSMFIRQTDEAQSETSLSKYSGDYERDPVYMRHLYSETEKKSHVNSSSARPQPLLRAMDDSSWNDDSGFSTFSGSRLSLQDREKGSSLPNLTKHVYQSLEAKTLEPLQPYEKLNKSRKETAV